MVKLYFRNEQTGKRYQIVRMDKEAGEVVLQGEHAEFTEKYDKEKFKKLGYTLEKEVEDAV